jgi:uncharacterized protein YbjT (DUF2867 family)
LIDIVTGAFSYIGRAISTHLLEAGRQVRTVTTHPDKPDPFGGAVAAAPLDFENLDRLEADLKGAATLYNTYWVRFEYGGMTFRQAVRHTADLFACARRAGVQKIVHIGVTHASDASRLPYYRGKWLQEQALKACGVPYAIVRPTLVFGPGDILVNNMAWLLRKSPVFPIFGSGDYRLQPVYVGDLARIAVDAAGRAGSTTEDAAGPETYTFEEFIRLLAGRIRPGTRLAHMPPWLALTAGRIIGEAIGDVILTRDELRGLMDSLLTSDQPASGTTAFSSWLESHTDGLGTGYASELGRHFRWKPPSGAQGSRRRGRSSDRQ